MRDEAIEIFADLLARRVGPNWAEGLARGAADRLADAGIAFERAAPPQD